MLDLEQHKLEVVDCRIGSLEMDWLIISDREVVDCRIGSLEK